MKVALIHDAVFPVAAYGGTERVVWWLGKALHELGHEAILFSRSESKWPFGERFPYDFSTESAPQLDSVDVCHYFATPSKLPKKPYVVTIGGNGRWGESYFPNTVFVSRNHASRHGSDQFVYNGVDPSEYQYSDKKLRYLLFLAKASWKVKNVSGAIKMARAAEIPLHIVGGQRLFFPRWRGIHWEGMIGGIEKARWISEAAGLLFPVIWNEPFGLAVVESLVSGTPVLTSPFGSLPELVSPEVGRICKNHNEFVDGILQLSQFSSRRCREWALEHFHYHQMARNYLNVYERVVGGELLNQVPLKVSDSPERLLPIPVFQNA